MLYIYKKNIYVCVYIWLLIANLSRPHRTLISTFTSAKLFLQFMTKKNRKVV